jgi:hypothetical protein
MKPSARLAAILFALGVLWIGGSAVHAQNTAAAASQGAHPTEAEIDRAITKIKADPNLGTSREVRRLKWVGKDRPPPKKDNSSLAWLRSLISWIGESARILLWVVVGIAIVALVLYLTRFLGDMGPRMGKSRRVTPTHVRDLDIRPESLPDDIGAAAIGLWQRNEHRAALSLLYRGLLSRLAHEHGVPIRDSSTEGDCLALALQHLPEDRSAYVSRLVKVWQRAVYGGKDPDAQTVSELCNEFAAALDRRNPPLQAQPA